MNEQKAQNTRIGLLTNWNISSRDDLIATIESMTRNGHNKRFVEACVLAKESDFDTNASDMFNDDEFYMWPFTETIGDRWNDKQILAWY